MWNVQFFIPCMKWVIYEFCEPGDYCLISVRHQINEFIFVTEKGELTVNSNKFLVKRQSLCFVNAAACGGMYFIINNFALQIVKHPLRWFKVSFRQSKRFNMLKKCFKNSFNLKAPIFFNMLKRYNSANPTKRQGWYQCPVSYWVFS